MDILTIFAERLKELMEDNNLNTLTLEKATGIKNSSLSCWLNKQYSPLLKNLITLSEYFKCSIDFLLGRAELPEIKETTLVSNFTTRLESLSAEKNKTLHAVAVDLKMDDATLYNWRNGKYIPSVPGLILLGDYFGCSVDYLIGRQE